MDEQRNRVRVVRKGKVMCRAKHGTPAGCREKASNSAEKEGEKVRGTERRASQHGRRQRGGWPHPGHRKSDRLSHRQTDVIHKVTRASPVERDEAAGSHGTIAHTLGAARASRNRRGSSFYGACDIVKAETHAVPDVRACVLTRCEDAP